MPRPKKDGSTEPKKRSRTGCWPCKARKVKCGEEKPGCANCVKSGEQCDYSIRLNWGGRGKREGSPTDGGFTFVTTPTSGAQARPGSGHEHVFSAQHIATAPSQRPPSSHPTNLPTPDVTPEEGAALGPRLNARSHYRSHPSGDLSVLLPQTPLLPQLHGPMEGHTPNDDFRWSPQHSAKRVKLSPTQHNGQPAQLHPVFAVPQYPPPVDASPGSTYFTPHTISSIVNTPATPGSSIASGSPYPLQTPSLTVQDPPDLRRLSVKSLLSDPSDDFDKPRLFRADSAGQRNYGFDHGFPDHDIPRNDDGQALLPRSPDLRRASAAVSEASNSSAEPDASKMAFESGGYYAQPVAVKIPRNLEPLPDELANNPMNMLYFHHFINHTGRIMVPHDCPENPFRGVMPQMAVRNRQLLHLMLTYSASHRARLLGHAEPANRIAAWMGDVLPALRRSLGEPASPGVHDPRDPSSLAPLATAIMLASLEIVSPNTFAVSISWQNHLNVARQMIIAKGGLHHLAQQADGARDKAIFFLSRWFAYLDVLGSLSGSKQDKPMDGAYMEDGGGLWLVNRSDEEIYQIDCFFGFSGRCIALLAQVAELSTQCDNQRIDPITQQVKVGWQPRDDVRNQAEELRKRLEASAKTVYRGCMHTQNTISSPHSTIEAVTDRDIEEIYAVNEAYHYAGLLHLATRVLNHQSFSPTVQDLVQKVIRVLMKVRRGSTAESCLLFPMFTAGCEAQTEEEREIFMGRLREIEGWGLSQVGAARAVMSRVWGEGRAWVTIVEGEFLG
ncbi:hypothetical protein LTR78_002668 [Recurvomyces mirabilis]|uniref:Zn(2)-C6 fungal-type domain-containing protein n=1 Tax=Recurvomyces mirabilis TaxID=574656 RepID=A0AAE1C4I7_9PEZI|nr:hypothetical protein LTR78_002668 [Recurvomyces mirabilis]KAK5157597.1 hypothetical protein LTS14_004362 [Recurvomyces mirabilis]